MNETRQLVHFVVSTRYEDLPSEVVEKVKGFILDNLACGLVGSQQAWARMVGDMVREASCKGECTVFGNKWRTDASRAALTNGIAVSGFEMDHGHTKASAHPGSAVFSALTAMAEREHKDGKTFLAAMALSYEGLCRIGMAATRALEDKRGYHGPATNAPFGGAMAVGKLLGFDEATLLNAMGIAGSHAAGISEFAWEGAMTKRLHIGRGGQMGLESAILASKGFTGPSTVLEGKFGYFNVFSPSPQIDNLLANIGKKWALMDINSKMFAAHGTQRSVIEAMLRFKEKKVKPESIKRIVVTASHHMRSKHEDREPNSIMGMQFSMPFAVAVALLKDIYNPLVYNEETLWDKNVREVAKKVEVLDDDAKYGPHIEDLMAEVVVEYDGKREVLEAKGFKGSPSNPFTLKDFENKFRRSAPQFIGEARTNDVVKKVTEIEKLKAVAELAKLVGG